MMSIDQELFQMIVIGLLAISLLVSLLNLSTLSRVKKQVNESSFASTGTASLADLASPDTSFVSPYASDTAVQPAAAQPLQAQATPQQVYGQPAYSAPEPVQAAPLQAAPVAQAAPMQTAAVQAAPESAEPQEQPFERDGRWWFRRGAELLVYDEQSAQWVPAPSGGGMTTATLTDGGAGGDTGGFWKCPSCGAVNGSTATSCRMCFTARA